MLSLTKSLLEENEFSRLIAAIDNGMCPAALSGVGNIHRAHAISALRVEMKLPVVAVCADEMDIKRILRDVEELTGETVRVLTGRDFTFYNAESVSRPGEQRRLEILYKMAAGGAPLVLTTLDGLMMRTIPAEKLLSAAVTASGRQRV